MARVRRATLLALPAGLAAVVSGTSAGATAGAGAGSILYDAGRTCVGPRACGARFNDAIYVVAGPRAAPRRLTARRYSDSQPAWSLDRRLIAFTRFRPGLGFDVYVMHADGTGARRLTHSRDGKAAQPDWSPDGSRIVYRDASPNDRTFDLYTIRLDGSHRVDLTRNPDNVSSENPSWSRGGRIAFVRGLFGRASSVGVYSIGAGGSAPRLLPPHCDAPSWSPDGKRIAATLLLGARAGHVAVFQVGAEATRRLAVGPLGGNPAWPPDGRRIVFERLQALALVSADGSGLSTAVAEPPGVVLENPDW